jgi:predicted nuclease of predicted toxin-antitoxin system
MVRGFLLGGELMQFLVNANFGNDMVGAIRELGFEAKSAFSIFGPKYPDMEILDWATKNNYIIVTNDGDFGTLVYKDNMPHVGIIFIRSRNQRQAILLLTQYLKEGHDATNQMVRLP